MVARRIRDGWRVVMGNVIIAGTVAHLVMALLYGLGGAMGRWRPR